MLHLRDLHKECDMHDNPQQAVLWSYIAGIIDGEGCFMMRRISPKAKCLKGGNYKNPKYMPMFSIGMVDRRIPDLLCETTGYSNVREERVRNRRSIWRWALSGSNNLPDFINNVMPYLIVKKQHAEIILEFFDKMETPHNRKLGLSENELLRREELYQKIKKLNATGAAATTEYSNCREVEATV